MPRQILLDQSGWMAIVLVCFQTRKREEAWNPGNFGCRGLLVYGLRDARVSESWEPHLPLRVGETSAKTPGTQRWFGVPLAAFLFAEASLDREVTSHRTSLGRPAPIRGLPVSSKLL